jgi:hypothetical protein
MISKGSDPLKNVELRLRRAMQRIKFMVQLFLIEPLWFRILISTTLLISLVFSSSFFSDQAYFQSISKLAAAIFFSAYGYKLRRNRVNSILFFSLAGVCMYLSWLAINKT